MHFLRACALLSICLLLESCCFAPTDDEKRDSARHEAARAGAESSGIADAWSAPRLDATPPDAATADAAASRDVRRADDVTGADTRDAARVAGRLCVRRAVVGDDVGKGTASPGTTLEQRRARARKLAAGFELHVGDKELRVDSDAGGLVDGLALDESHLVVVRARDGSRHSTFRVRFSAEEPVVCARYDAFYDNWRVRPWNGRSRCGGCCTGEHPCPSSSP